MRLITGALKPNKGEIIVYGKRIRNLRDSIGLTAMLPSNPVSVIIGPTVKKDIERACRAFKQGNRDCSHLLHKYGLVEFEERLVSKLSEGEIRLLSVLSIVSLGTKVILMDEPTIGLDKAFRKKLVDILRNECVGKTVVIATNDLRLASYADKVIVLERGYVISHGDPKEVFYKLNADWFYSPIVDFVKKMNNKVLQDKKPITPEDLTRYLRVLLDGS